MPTLTPSPVAAVTSAPHVSSASLALGPTPAPARTATPYWTLQTLLSPTPTPAATAAPVLSITSGAAAPATVLQPSPVAIVVSVVPTPIDGGVRTDHIFTVGNAGAKANQFGSLSIAGDPAFTIRDDHVTGALLAAGTFDVDGNLLATGGQATFTVRFSPTALGQVSAIVTVPSSDPNSPLLIEVKGEGIAHAAPAITVDPPSWTAGDVALGDSVTQIVTASNPGSAPLLIGSLALDGTGFSSSADGLTGATLEPGDSATVLLTFSPAATGVITGSLTIPSNAGDDQVIALIGNGVAIVQPPPPVSVTRWYLGRQASPVGAIANSGWDAHTTDRDDAMTAAKGGAAVSLGANIQTTGHYCRVRLGRWVSPPLAAQRFRGTISCYMMAERADALGAKVTSALRAGVYHGSSVAWGSLLTASTADEAWPSSTDDEAARRFPAGPFGTWGLDLTFTDGDRLVIELGAHALTTQIGGVRLRWGGASTGVDLQATIVPQDPTRAPYIETTGGILMLP